MKTINIIVLLFALVGCAKESTIDTPITPIVQNDSLAILGEWEWKETLIAWGNEIQTPSTTGDSISLTFTSDSLYKYTNGSLTDVKYYQFEYYYFNTGVGPDSILGLFINQVDFFYSIDGDTLIIDKSYVDGNKDTYIKN